MRVVLVFLALIAVASAATLHPTKAPEKGHHVKLEKHHKIAIVGAGPSGLHMAHLLNQHGYANLQIYEQTDRFGGKTVTIPHRTVKDCYHEMGTCYMHPAYFAVRDFAKELVSLGARVNVSEEANPAYVANYRVFTSDPFFKKYIEKTGYMNFDDYVFAASAEATLPAFLRFMPDKLQQFTIFYEVQKYNIHHHKLFGKKYDAVPEYNAESLKEMSVSLAEFLINNKLKALVPLAMYGYSAQGYGIIDKIPAFYGMNWFTPEMLNGYLFAGTPFGKFPRKTMWRNGWHRMWEELVFVNKLEPKIKLNSDIKKITRENKDGGITIQGTTAGAPFTEKFDYLVMAAPPSLAHTYLDVNAAERDAFTGLVPHTFRTTLYERSPEPDRKAHLDFWVDPLSFDKPDVGTGVVHAMRDSMIADFGDLHGTEKLPREQMCYQFSSQSRDALSGAELTKFDADLKGKAEHYIQSVCDKGFKYTILSELVVSYFYHFPAANLANIWKILGLQGENRTLFVHASALFESVLDIIHYNNRLFNTVTA